mmetsp:Transcript_15493/g.23797  ORF Transcript_15493/g.23797 Transcript_15493/m.23797 type:complete len:119 (-) Transcript_15493:45-401(-)
MIEGIAKLEKFFKDNLQGNYFSGEAEPMYIDIAIYSLAEKLVVLGNSNHWSEKVKQLNLSTSAPTVLAYVQRLSQHPVFKPHAVIQEEFDNWLIKMDKQELGVKAQIDVEMLTDAPPA